MSEALLWTSLIRDVGLILGIPALIVVGVKLYTQQIEILKARNELLRETQYDRAVSLLESQKKVFLIEREILDKRVTDLERLVSEKDATIGDVKQMFRELRDDIKNVTESARALNPENWERLSAEYKLTHPDGDK